jgi:hypothetical protein
MPNRVQTLRSSVPGSMPQAATRAPGELWLNFADAHLGYINAAQTAQKLLAVRLFMTTAPYAVGDFVVYAGALYQATAPSAAGAFTAANWARLATMQDLTGVAALYLPLTGGALSGALTLAADPTAALGAVTKQYVDLRSGAVSVGATPPASPNLGALWWDTVSGQLYVWYNDGNSTQWVISTNSNAVVPVASTAPPLMDGTAAPGSSAAFACGDHRHPTDTSRAASTDLANYLPLAGGTVTGPLTMVGGNTLTVNGGLSVTNAANVGGTLNATFITCGQNTISLGNGGGNFGNRSSFGVNFINGVWSNTGAALAVGVTSTTAGTNLVGFFANSTTAAGTITYQNPGVAYNTASDMRLKRDERSFDAGPILDALQIYDFEWKTTPGVRAHGVMAQEANEVFPDAVTYHEDTDWWGVDYSKFVPLLLQEIKTLRERVSVLEAR